MSTIRTKIEYNFDVMLIIEIKSQKSIITSTILSNQTNACTTISQFIDENFRKSSKENKEINIYIIVQKKIIEILKNDEVSFEKFSYKNEKFVLSLKMKEKFQAKIKKKKSKNRDFKQIERTKKTKKIKQKFTFNKFTNYKRTYSLITNSFEKNHHDRTMKRLVKNSFEKNHHIRTMKRFDDDLIKYIETFDENSIQTMNSKFDLKNVMISFRKSFTRRSKSNTIFVQKKLSKKQTLINRTKTNRLKTSEASQIKKFFEKKTLIHRTKTNSVLKMIKSFESKSSIMKFRFFFFIHRTRKAQSMKNIK